MITKYIYIYIYIYKGKTGNKSDSVKMYTDERHKVFNGWFYLQKFLPALNVSVFRPSSGHVNYLLKQKYDQVLKHSISVGSILFQIDVITVPKFVKTIHITLVNLSIYVSMFICLFVCVLWLINICRLLIPDPFYTNKQFRFKQFSLALMHSLIVKNIPNSSYSV